MPKKGAALSEQEMLYDKLVATLPNAERKGDTIHYTSINGNMYSYLAKDGFVALRLPEEERQKFLEKYNSTLVTTYGIVQKEYVTVPADLLKNTNELKRYFKKSFDYAGTLKPKPTKKAKKE